MEPQSQVVTSQANKRTNKPLIFGIIGVLVLTAAVAAGVILVQRQQDIREQAKIRYSTEKEEAAIRDPSRYKPAFVPTYTTEQQEAAIRPDISQRSDQGTVTDLGTGGGGDGGEAPAGGGGGSGGGAPSSGSVTDLTDGYRYKGTGLCNPNTNRCSATNTTNVVYCKCEGVATRTCRDDCVVGEQNTIDPNFCGSQQLDVQNDSGVSDFISYINSCGSGGGETMTAAGGGGDGGGSETPPPPPPGVAAQCVDIRFYDLSWNRLTISDLTKLSANSIVRIAVAGSATSGGIDQARFTINGTGLAPTTQQRTTTQEFYTDYKIPEGVTSFTIGAQVHHPTLGWF